MLKNIFIDLNVIVDVLLERQGFEASKEVILLGERGSYRLWLSAHCVTTLAYLLERAKLPPAQVLEHLIWVVDSFGIIPVNEQLLRAATLSLLSDYEDAVIEQAALKANAEVIATKNVRDFSQSVIPAQTPAQYLASLH